VAHGVRRPAKVLLGSELPPPHLCLPLAFSSPLRVLVSLPPRFAFPHSLLISSLLAPFSDSCYHYVEMPYSKKGKLISWPRKWIFTGVAIAVAMAVVGVILVLTDHRQSPVGTEVGQTAPDFTLSDFQGVDISLSGFRGQVVILEFWQSSCPDCRRETPYLDELYRRYKDRGVIWLGVNLDHDHHAAQKYLEDNGLAGDQTTVGKDYSAAMSVVDLFSVSLVPCVFVIDRRGIIRYRGVSPDKPYAGDIEPWL